MLMVVCVCGPSDEGLAERQTSEDSTDHIKWGSANGWTLSFDGGS